MPVLKISIEFETDQMLEILQNQFRLRKIDSELELDIDIEFDLKVREFTKLLVQ